MPTTPDPLGIDVSACRGRQRRLLAVMEKLKLDLVIITQNQHVQYLVGPRYEWTFSPAVALRADGHAILIAPQEPAEPVAADEIHKYLAKSFSTLRNDQRHQSTEVLLAALSSKAAAKRIGVEFSSFGPELASRFSAELVDVEPELYQLRRRKDPDEIAKLRKAIAGTEAMHRRSREIIEPGVNELYVFNELQAAAVLEYGEMLTGTGNDYASGAKGGHPRNRKIEAGELYILDLGPAFRGYFADNTRVTAVGGKPTDDQHKAWKHILEVFAVVEQTVKPGKSCRELFEHAYKWLNQIEGLSENRLGEGDSPILLPGHRKIGTDPAGSRTGPKPWEFEHHLGHGIGLFPHEAPHLNPFWDDTFQPGEVFAVEPGLYGPGLKAGIRLENNYLVTDGGVELLTPFPMEMA